MEYIGLKVREKGNVSEEKDEGKEFQSKGECERATDIKSVTAVGTTEHSEELVQHSSALLMLK